MDTKHKKIQFYKHSKKGFLLRLLTADDVSFWGANSLISVIFALFVVANIEQATAVDVGIALTIREITLAVLSIPIGRIFDKHKGLLDEVYFLSISGLLVGFSYILLSFSTQTWHLFCIMIIIGISHAINLNAWRTLFYGSIKQSERGETVGVYQTIFSISGALFLSIGGFIGDSYGSDVVLIAGGIISIIGGILPLYLKKIIK